MSSVCNKISANITLDCDNPPVGGVSETLYLFNFDDWQDATYTVDPTNSQVINSLITLQSGVTGYKIEGYSNTVRPLVDFSKNEGRPSYKHTVNFQVANDSTDANLQVKRIGGGKFVAVVINNNQTIKVYGAGSGLESADQTLQDYYASNASFTLQLTSNDETLEVTPPLTYVGAASPYAFATAKSEIEALIAA